MVPSVSTIGTSLKSTPAGGLELEAQTPVIFPSLIITFPLLITLVSPSIVTTLPFSKKALDESVFDILKHWTMFCPTV